MAVIGIITCEILELEFAWLLGDDRDIQRISVLEDSHSRRLIELLEARQAPNLRCLPHPHAFTPEPDEPLEVLVRVLAMGLHRNRKVLRHALAKSAQGLRPHIDVLLLGYGLCGGALNDAPAVVDMDIPVFQPMDDNHPIDDCIALCMGGRERYYSEQRKIAGTYFLTPGWSRHWRRMLDMDSGEVSQPGLKRLLYDYERVLLLESPVIPDDELQRRGAQFGRLTGLCLETQAGTLTPLTAAWNATKAALQPCSTCNTAEGSR
ncbi:MAG: DUF1638 domain-containing protein [Candidatus Thiodiazotropha sp.]|jgi:hypothetical protein